MDITKLLDDYIAQEEKKREGRVSSGKWKPSMFGACFRRQWWSKHQEKETNPVDDRTKRVFLAGHKFHEFVQDLIPQKQCEILIETDDIKGYADIVTDDYVIDIKSQHSKAFWFMEKNCTDIIKEKLSNWLQVGWYAIQLKKERCKLVFISKDDLCIKEFDVATEKLKDLVEKEISTLLSLKELPKAKPRLYPIRKKEIFNDVEVYVETGKFNECRYCAFKDKCKEVERGN